MLSSLLHKWFHGDWLVRTNPRCSFARKISWENAQLLITIRTSQLMIYRASLISTFSSNLLEKNDRFNHPWSVKGFLGFPIPALDSGKQRSPSLKLT